MATTKFDHEKFSGTNDFSLLRIKMKALLVYNGLFDAINEEAGDAEKEKKKSEETEAKAHGAILLCLGDEVLQHVTEEGTTLAV